MKNNMTVAIPLLPLGVGSPPPHEATMGLFLPAASTSARARLAIQRPRA
jgi:hypothetical protein